MSQYRVLRNVKTGAPVLARAQWCASYWCRFRGLMLRRSLPEDEGLLFVYGSESIVGSSIHMLFMFFAIATVWLDADGKVVDAVLAKPWRPMYAPRKPAKYVIEARPSLLDRVAIGDRLRFD
ncbi:MAG: DUF192 domain-containing protein [Anaerolineae bacterium]|nr:DUF192 domain-containing protein [Anaerolineae bacterium]